MSNLFHRLIVRPMGFIRRAFFKLIRGPLRYRTPDGYDAERYWRDRLLRYGPLLRGPGHEGLSETENRQQYAQAAATLLDACVHEGIDFQRARVLEVGCGNGFYTRLCREQGVISYTGVDVTDALFPDLTARFPGYEFVKADVTREVLSGTYDLILLIDVLEHITEEPGFEAALASLRKCIGERGVMVVALPDPERHPRQRLFYLRLWTEAEFFSRLGDLGATQRRPFRSGHLYTLRRLGPPAGE